MTKLPRANATAISASAGNIRSKARCFQQTRPAITHNKGDKINVGRVIPSQPGDVYLGSQAKAAVKPAVKTIRTKANPSTRRPPRRSSHTAQIIPMGRTCTDGGQVAGRKIFTACAIGANNPDHSMVTRQWSNSDRETTRKLTAIHLENARLPRAPMSQSSAASTPDNRNM